MPKRPPKKRGPKPTGKGTQIQVRVQPAQLAALGTWIKRRPKPRPTRPQAIRQLMEIALKAKPRR